LTGYGPIVSKYAQAQQWILPPPRICPGTPADPSSRGNSRDVTGMERVNQEKKRLAKVVRTEEFNTVKTMWIGKEQET
jgi:hypothetical protein